MNENMFGPLSTVAGRADYLLSQHQGVRHLNRLHPMAPGPHDRPAVTVTVVLDRRIARVECVLLAPGAAVLPLTLARTEWDMLGWSYRQVWQVRLPAHPDGALVRYRLRAIPAGGGEPIWADDGATYSYLVDSAPPPAWGRQAVIYQIFPDRFHPGPGRAWNRVDGLEDIYGGTLAGIIQQLDYVADLGFNTIWLNPFLPDDTHHGYHAVDHFSVNPRLGTMAELDALVAAAHQRGLRLLLDFVANHVGRDHPHFQDALARADSPYHDWFCWRRWPDDYLAYFDVPELPVLNTDNPAVREYLFRSARFWLERGFDGLRIDYAPGPSLDFWTALRAAVRTTHPDAWLFGETTHAPPVLLTYDGRFHGSLDFLLAQKLRDTFAFNTMDVAQLDTFLVHHDAYFPAHLMRPSFLDNHDMNRFLFIAGQDRRKLQLAALCLFTLAGPPIVYNGTEVGVTQERSIGHPESQGMAECRQPMRWGEAQDQELLAYFRRLIHFRRRHPVLWQGARHTLHLNPEAGTWVYGVSNDQETVLVAFNLSDAPHTVPVTLLAGGAHTFALAPWSGDTHVAATGS